VDTKTNVAPGDRLCAGDDCRHRKALKNVKADVRKIYHDLGQPLMVIQGYLELIELKKLDNDSQVMEQIMAAVSSQLGALQEIQERLKETIITDRLEKNEMETEEGI
jgi:signal transduction histidine kinase